MNKRITAVISDYYASAIQYIKKEFKIKKQNIKEGTFELEDGRLLVIITEINQARAWEFTDYIVDPTYQSLEQVVKSRIR